MSDQPQSDSYVQAHPPTLIAVMGTMGSGKTTAVRLLAERLLFRHVEENFEDNQFLAKFYQDPKRWAFHSQTFFLVEKAKHLQSLSLLQVDRPILVDTPLEQDVFSYAQAQQRQKTMNQAEWVLYQQLYHLLLPQLPAIKLYIYLDASLDELERRINLRGRNFEQRIKRSYLRQLDRLNKDFLAAHPHLHVLHINTNHLDIAHDSAAQDHFVQLISDTLNHYKLLSTQIDALPLMANTRHLPAS